MEVAILSYIYIWPILLINWGLIGVLGNSGWAPGGLRVSYRRTGVPPGVGASLIVNQLMVGLKILIVCDAKCEVVR